jgi:penicillin-binding protein 2
MYGVINEGGTGSSLKLQNIEFSGKSGTAQLMSYTAGNKMGKKGKETNGWFVGYAPRRNPEIVVAAVIQGSSEHGGVTAGPVVRDIVKAYFDKKAGAKIQEYTAKKEAPPKVVPASVEDDPSLQPDPPSR